MIKRYIYEKAENFTGRKWVFDAIDRWYRNPEGKRIFLLIGEPGSGKSAIASRLVQFSQNEEAALEDTSPFPPNFLSAFYFCGEESPLPNNLIESLENQLVGQPAIE